MLILLKKITTVINYLLMKTKNILKLTTFCFTTYFLNPISTFSQAGSLDLSFNSTGVVTTDFSGKTDSGLATALQADGKIVVAGTSSNGTDLDFSIARYNTDGSLDNSFDTDGKQITPIGIGLDRGFAVKIQADGKILVAGYTNDGTQSDFALVRYNTNGSLDNTFDSDGKIITDFNGLDDNATSIAIQADGKIIVVGYTYTNAGQDIAIIRYNVDGSLDNTFDTDGKLTTDYLNSYDYSSSVALQSNGKIVVSGYSTIGSDINFTLFRYNTDGSLDNTLDTDGKLTTAFTSNVNFSTSVAIQADGKIIVVGESSNGTDRDNAIVRYNVDGSLDNTFHADGKLTTPIGSSDNGASSVAIQADGKILVSGYARINSFDDVTLIRYETDGSLDNTFDSDGFVTYSSAGKYLMGNALAIQSDGKIIIAGLNGSDYLVLRYNYASSSALGMIENSTNSSETMVSPNPSSGKLNLKLSKEYDQIQVRILNALGQVLETKNYNSSNNIALNIENEKGIYFLEIKADNENTQKIKIIKE